jgi:uncharacterized protein YcaQ
MPDLTLTKSQARRFLLAYQNLWPPRGLRGKTGLLDHIRRVGCIQFDPLNMVGRNPELVLQSRLADFRPEMLGALLYDERRLLDGWDKMMSIYRLEDWPHFRRRRETTRSWPRHNQPEVLAVLPQVRAEIQARGPLSSIDLDFDQTVDWSWAPTRLARAALESLYNWGELVVHHKVNTRKFYDFARRHIPVELFEAPDPFASQEDFDDWYVLRRLGGVGLLPERSSDGWLGMWELKTPRRAAALSRLLAAGRVRRVEVQGQRYPLYMRSQDEDTLQAVLDGMPPARRAAFLAPLDNLIWDRALIEALFDFEYRWEVYKPVAQRRWGYYVLPVLYGERFVARCEPQLDKKTGVLRMENWWWQPGVRRSKAMDAALSKALGCFIEYLGASQVQIDPPLVEREALGGIIGLLDL